MRWILIVFISLLAYSVHNRKINNSIYTSLMKNTIIASLVVVGISLGACSKSNDNSGIEAEKLRATLKSGIWKIVSLKEGNDDHTDDFKNCKLEFESNGALNATLDSNQYSGLWKLDVEDDDDHHRSHHVVELEMFFNSTAKIKKLNDDWHLYEQSETRVVFNDDSDDREILIIERE